MFILPKIPYSFDALEPFIDARTMEVHHSKHHQTYVDKLNAALQNYEELSKKPVENLLMSLDSVPKEIQTAVANNGGGHFNHSFFWEIMVPNGTKFPTSGNLATEISKYFQNFETFKKKFSEEALNRFGSGWAWLSVDKEGKLIIHSTANQDSPISADLKPVLALDLWEHAYYLKYQNRRADYIESWWNVVNWNQVEENLKVSLK